MYIKYLNNIHKIDNYLSIVSGDENQIKLLKNDGFYTLVFENNLIRNDVLKTIWSELEKDTNDNLYIKFQNNIHNINKYLSIVSGDDKQIKLLKNEGFYTLVFESNSIRNDILKTIWSELNKNVYYLNIDNFIKNDIQTIPNTIYYRLCLDVDELVRMLSKSHKYNVI
jgi:very-short-patch-repair endonuclease